MDHPDQQEHDSESIIHCAKRCKTVHDGFQSSPSSSSSPLLHEVVDREQTDISNSMYSHPPTDLHVYANPQHHSQSSITCDRFGSFDLNSTLITHLNGGLPQHTPYSRSSDDLSTLSSFPFQIHPSCFPAGSDRVEVPANSNHIASPRQGNGPSITPHHQSRLIRPFQFAAIRPDVTSEEYDQLDSVSYHAFLSRYLPFISLFVSNPALSHPPLQHQASHSDIDGKEATLTHPMTNINPMELALYLLQTLRSHIIPSLTLSSFSHLMSFSSITRLNQQSVVSHHITLNGLPQTPSEVHTNTVPPSNGTGTVPLSMVQEMMLYLLPPFSTPQHVWVFVQAVVSTMTQYHHMSTQAQTLTLWFIHCFIPPQLPSPPSMSKEMTSFDDIVRKTYNEGSIPPANQCSTRFTTATAVEFQDIFFPRYCSPPSSSPPSSSPSHPTHTGSSSTSSSNNNNNKNTNIPIFTALYWVSIMIFYNLYILHHILPPSPLSSIPLFDIIPLPSDVVNGEHLSTVKYHIKQTILSPQSIPHIAHITTIFITVAQCYDNFTSFIHQIHHGLEKANSGDHGGLVSLSLSHESLSQILTRVFPLSPSTVTPHSKITMHEEYLVSLSTQISTTLSRLASNITADTPTRGHTDGSALTVDGGVSIIDVPSSHARDNHIVSLVNDGHIPSIETLCLTILSPPHSDHHHHQKHDQEQSTDPSHHSHSHPHPCPTSMRYLPKAYIPLHHPQYEHFSFPYQHKEALHQEEFEHNYQRLQVRKHKGHPGKENGPTNHPQQSISAVDVSTDIHHNKHFIPPPASPMSMVYPTLVLSSRGIPDEPRQETRSLGETINITSQALQSVLRVARLGGSGGSSKQRRNTHHLHHLYQQQQHQQPLIPASHLQQQQQQQQQNQHRDAIPLQGSSVSALAPYHMLMTQLRNGVKLSTILRTFRSYHQASSRNTNKHKEKARHSQGGKEDTKTKPRQIIEQTDVQDAVVDVDHSLLAIGMVDGEDEGNQADPPQQPHRTVQVSQITPGDRNHTNTNTNTNTNTGTHQQPTGSSSLPRTQMTTLDPIWANIAQFQDCHHPLYRWLSPPSPSPYFSTKAVSLNQQFLAISSMLLNANLACQSICFPIHPLLSTYQPSHKTLDTLIHSYITHLHGLSSGDSPLHHPLAPLDTYHYFCPLDMVLFSSYSHLLRQSTSQHSSNPHPTPLSTLFPPGLLSPFEFHWDYFRVYDPQLNPSRMSVLDVPCQSMIHGTSTRKGSHEGKGRPKPVTYVDMLKRISKKLRKR